MSAATPQTPAPTFAIATQYRAKESVVVPILAPTDLTTPTGITLTLAGRYSEAFEAAQKASKTDLPPEATDADVVRALATHAVTAWAGVLDADGEPVPVSPAQVAALFDAVPWLYEQARRALLDLTRFFETAKAS